ncbi:MFS transporter [Paraburkholderia susongensis]|uniref:Sugar phosphate permease n=1 Tax=Paraburkholderia susongensis TaxID=1515439 RepID=A0A1X7M3T8_9BURK|nr:MFS transporter [Paraburkholderia susongensis]SMG60721.1 Sugar phosphate permease [Paraburkholderia susongensis]
MQISENQQFLPDSGIERRILVKISARLMPILMLGIFISYIDRANLGVLFGPLSKDLGLTASSFGLAAGLFYIGYLLFEIPSNMGMVKFGARLWLARIMITWGAVTVALAATQGTTSLYVLRILLGVAEAGYYPGVVFFLTLWFPPRMLTRAYSTLTICIPLSLAVGSILTSLMLRMHGIAGLAGWRWVFILQGAPAILLGICTFLALPDRPDKAKWLSAEEKNYLAKELPAAREAESVDLRHLPSILRSKSVWVLSFLYFATLIGVWAVTFFLPKIVQERLHVGSVDAGLISSIPWICAAIATFIVGRTSASSGERRWHLLVLLGLAAIGLYLSAAVDSPYIALIGLCFGAAGMQAAVPLFWTIPTSMFRGAGAAIAIAMINSLGNVSGLAGPWLFGVFRDLTGSSSVGLYVISSFTLVSAALAFVMSTTVDAVPKIRTAD